MENHTLLGLVTAAFGLLVYMVQPEPLRSVVLTNEITSIVFYVAVVALTLALMRKAPEEDVDSGGKAVFITGEWTILNAGHFNHPGVLTIKYIAR